MLGQGPTREVLLRVLLVPSREGLYYAIRRHGVESSEQWATRTVAGVECRVLLDPSRLTVGEVEGSLSELKEVAHAILSGGSVHYDRCYVQVEPNLVRLGRERSPSGEVLLTPEEAKDLAEQILAEVTKVERKDIDGEA